MSLKFALNLFLLITLGTNAHEPIIDGYPVDPYSNGTVIDTKQPTKNECHLSYDSNLNVNKIRLCPVFYSFNKKAWNTGYAHTTTSGTCNCSLERSSKRGTCTQVRMPVTELQWRFNRTRLVEAVVLRNVDCATLIGQQQPERPVPVTGKQMRNEGRKIGQKIFGEVNCEDTSEDGRPQAKATYGLRVSTSQIPRLEPEARCICRGQTVTSLPLPVLKLVGGDGSSGPLYAIQDVDVIGVGCAVLQTK